MYQKNYLVFYYVYLCAACLKCCFIYLLDIGLHDGRCTCEIKSRITMTKAAFNKKKTLFTSKLDLNLRKKLVNCYIWSMFLYGAETWMLQAADQKYAPGKF